MADLIIGRRPVLEALKARKPIEKILILYGIKGEGIDTILRIAREEGVLWEEGSKDEFKEFESRGVTQGVVAYVGSGKEAELEDFLEAAKEKDEDPFILILDEIEDPQNLGALIRTAECAGVHGVIIPKHHSAQITEAVARASAGASAHLPVARVTNIARTLDELKKSNVWIVGTDMRAEKTYYEMDYKGAVAIVVGNEGRGIRRLVKEKCDFLVKIPLYGKIESLNVSVSGALVMYEVAKGRKRKD